MAAPWFAPLALLSAAGATVPPVGISADEPPAETRAAPLQIGPKSPPAPGAASPYADPADGALARMPHPGPAFDREPDQPGHELHLGALLRVLFEHTTGDPFGEDISGAEFREVLLFAHARLEAFEFFAEIDFASDLAELPEAWVELPLDQNHRLRVGQVQRHFLRSNDWHDDALPLPERSRLDDLTTVQSEGIVLSGNYDRARLYGSLQNGEDGALSAWLGSARLEFDLLGRGVPVRGDGLDADRHLQLTAGVAYADDGTVSEGDTLGLDMAMRWEGLGVHLEWADFGRDLGGGSPASATVTALLDREVLELGLRAERLDDGADTKIYGVGLTRWILPARVKVQVGVERVSSDDSGIQGTRFLLGSVVSF